MTEELKLQYLNRDFPYRLNSLMAHDMILHRKKQAHFDEIKDRCYGDSLVVEPVFEISPIFGRSLLNFLGLGLDYKTNKINRKEPRGTDFSIKNLFPEREFCALDDPIILQHNDNLATLIRIADKSVAHLTSVLTQESDHEKLPYARKAVYDLILKHIPEINKQNIWWYTQISQT